MKVVAFLLNGKRLGMLTSRRLHTMITTHKLYRTCTNILGALCLASAAFGQTILPPSQVGNIGPNNWNVSQPISIPFGTANDLPSLTVNYGDTEKNVGLLQFDLTGFTTPVASATLEIYHALNQLGAGSSAQFGLFQNLSSWVGTIGDWNDLPAVASAPVASNLVTDTDVGLFRSWDVTAIVNDWISGGAQNYGLRLERIDEVNPYFYFSSADGVWIDTQLFAPKLTLTEGVSAVPEPSTYGALGALALIGLIVRVRIKRRVA